MITKLFSPGSEMRQVSFPRLLLLYFDSSGLSCTTSATDVRLKICTKGLEDPLLGHSVMPPTIATYEKYSELKTAIGDS